MLWLGRVLPPGKGTLSAPPIHPCDIITNFLFPEHLGLGLPWHQTPLTRQAMPLIPPALPSFCTLF